MSGDVHAGFYERRGVRLPPATHLTFSGGTGLVRGAAGVRRRVAEIAAEEGFAVNERRSTLVTRAGSQRVCGTVVNVRPNLARADYDELKAILHNAVRNGPTTENRAGVGDFRAHLLGRIAWLAALNPGRAEKLRQVFARIAWDDRPAPSGAPQSRR